MRSVYGAAVPVGEVVVGEASEDVQHADGGGRGAAAVFWAAKLCHAFVVPPPGVS